MEQIELQKRIADLAQRCARKNCVTNTAFLTPAEYFPLESGRFYTEDVTVFLFGGTEESERKVAFFLPPYWEEAEFDAEETIKAVKIRSFFGTPGHRDYLGALLGLGIERDRIGDIFIFDDLAYVFCLSTVCEMILHELDKVGRISVKTEQVSLAQVPPPVRKVKKLSFTVKSLRLDAVTGDLFGMSRTSAAELIRLGAVTLNYSVCEKTDAAIKEGDVLSVRGKGKGRIVQDGGRSRKDRLFVEAEIYL